MSTIIYRKPTKIVTVKKSGQLSTPKPVSTVGGGGQGGLLGTFQSGGNVA